MINNLSSFTKYYTSIDMNCLMTQYWIYIRPVNFLNLTLALRSTSRGGAVYWLDRAQALPRFGRNFLYLYIVFKSPLKLESLYKFEKLRREKPPKSQSNWLKTSQLFSSIVKREKKKSCRRRKVEEEEEEQTKVVGVCTWVRKKKKKGPGARGQRKEREEIVLATSANLTMFNHI